MGNNHGARMDGQDLVSFGFLKNTHARMHAGMDSVSGLSRTKKVMYRFTWTSTHPERSAGFGSTITEGGMVFL